MTLARRRKVPPAAGACRIVFVRVVDRIDDRDRPAVSEDDLALIARLSAPLRIEIGAVEHNPARLGANDHIGLLSTR